ncbi:MAG: bacteriohemerythrin [Gammaproteobacteria bacterium]|nr:bacteriohemerythrin [Gammaproteobacteria bacterium]
MSFIEFNDSLKVDNKLIDQEHGVLIEYINLLQKAIENETSTRITGQVLEGLTEYTNTHFFVEEEMMKAYDYPDKANHMKAHDGFRNRLATLIEKHENGESELSNSVMEFLKEWLTEHILKIDRKLSDYLADKSFR